MCTLFLEHYSYNESINYKYLLLSHYHVCVIYTEHLYTYIHVCTCLHTHAHIQYPFFSFHIQNLKPVCNLKSSKIAELQYVRFQVLMATSKKMAVFWDVELCSLVNTV
jgi:hypothetical protein